eukprot:1690657-Rhodomonas_salina.3
MGGEQVCRESRQEAEEWDDYCFICTDGGNLVQSSAVGMRDAPSSTDGAYGATRCAATTVLGPCTRYDFP